MQQQLKEKGYVILKNFFEKDYIDNLRKGAERIFQIQFDRFGYDGEFKDNMIKLFNEHESIFINCGKIIQTGLIELYKLPVEEKLIDTIKNLGIELFIGEFKYDNTIKVNNSKAIRYYLK